MSGNGDQDPHPRAQGGNVCHGPRPAVGRHAVPAAGLPDRERFRDHRAPRSLRLRDRRSRSLDRGGVRGDSRKPDQHHSARRRAPHCPFACQGGRAAQGRPARAAPRAERPATESARGNAPRLSPRGHRRATRRWAPGQWGRGRDRVSRAARTRPVRNQGAVESRARIGIAAARGSRRPRDSAGVRRARCAGTGRDRRPDLREPGERRAGGAEGSCRRRPGLGPAREPGARRSPRKELRRRARRGNRRRHGRQHRAQPRRPHVGRTPSRAGHRDLRSRAPGIGLPDLVRKAHRFPQAAAFAARANRHAPRHRQDPAPQGVAREAGAAHAGGVRGGEDARGSRPRDSRADAEFPARDPRGDRPAPRAHERQRVSARARWKRDRRLRTHVGDRRLLRGPHQPPALRRGRVLLRGVAQPHRLGGGILPRSPGPAVRLFRRRVPSGIADRAVERRGRRGGRAQQGAAPQAARARGHRSRQDARAASDAARSSVRAEGRHRRRNCSACSIARRRSHAQPTASSRC